MSNNFKTQSGSAAKGNKTAAKQGSAYRVGIDIGSTTIKVVVLDAEENIVYKKYARHFSDIPSALVTGGYLTLSDVKVKIGEAATRDYTEIDTSGEYALIKVIDTYNQASDPFGYTVPAAGQGISVTFTVSGMAAE